MRVKFASRLDCDKGCGILIRCDKSSQTHDIGGIQMVEFGTRVGTVKELKQKVTASGGSQFITFVPEESKGTITVRFLTEPEEWLGYREIYDPIKKKSWPVPPDDSMPGSPEEDQRVTKRFLANAVNKEDDRVIAIKLPGSLVEQLLIRYERFNTMLDRDYLLGRTGSGMDTDYYCDAEPPTRFKSDKYTLLDLNAILVSTYEQVWGVDATTNSKPSRAPASKKAAAPKATPTGLEADEAASESLADLAARADDNDDAEAAEQLTAIADSAGIDPEAYELWADVVAALAEAGGAEPEAEEDDEDGDEEQSYTSMGAVVDDEGVNDAELLAQFMEVLTNAAEAQDLDVEDFETWEALGQELDGTSEVEAEEGTEEAEDEEEAEVVFTADELRGKQIGELRALARDQGINTTGLNKAALVDALASDEEEPF